MHHRNFFSLTKSLQFDDNCENRDIPPPISFEDFRGMVDNKPVICDQEGISFIYGEPFLLKL
jgi:hypothetical protein